MSYEKAMRHSRNVKKVKKQAKMYMGFDAGSGHWPSARSNPYLAAVLNIRDWFPQRNNGDAKERQHTRECIKEQIQDARKALG